MARHSLRLAVGVWLALAVAVAVRTVLSPVKHSVFPVFAASAAHWRADQPLYFRYPGFDLFRYPPPFAMVLAPFAALGLRAGGILWSWVGMALYAAGLFRFARNVLPGTWPRGRTAAFLALGLVGALPALWNAQSNPHVVGLLLLGASGLARQRWWTAAALFAAATWLKLTPLLPAVLLCCLWPRRLAPRFIAALAVGGLLPFLTRPVDVVLAHYIEWVSALTQNGGGRWPGFRDAWTAWQVTRDFCRGTVSPSPPPPIDWAGYAYLQLGSALATLAWCLWQRARQTGPGRVLQLALGMGTAWLMLFGPAVEHPTYAFLAPSLAWALLEWRTWPRGRWLIVAAFVLIAVLGWEPLVHPLLGRLPPLLAALPAGTALFAAWLIGYAQVSEDESRLSPSTERRMMTTARVVVTSSRPPIAAADADDTIPAEGPCRCDASPRPTSSATSGRTG